MKKSILVMMISGSCLAAAAQIPDTSRQLNPYPPDSTRLIPPAVETIPETTTPDTMRMPPAPPLNTDVRTNETADTTAVQPVSPDTQPATDTAIIPAVTLPSGDSVTTNAPPVQKEGMPVQQNVQVTTSTNYTMPRGVNNPELVLTGLNKWSALPVLNTYVPQDIVDKLKMEQGDKLYDITMVKTGENQYGYIARVQENGMYHNVTVNDNSTNNNTNNNTTTPNQ